MPPPHYVPGGSYPLPAEGASPKSVALLLRTSPRTLDGTKPDQVLCRPLSTSHEDGAVDVSDHPLRHDSNREALDPALAPTPQNYQASAPTRQGSTPPWLHPPTSRGLVRPLRPSSLSYLLVEYVSRPFDVEDVQSGAGSLGLAHGWSWWPARPLLCRRWRARSWWGRCSLLRLLALTLPSRRMMADGEALRISRDSPHPSEGISSARIGELPRNALKMRKIWLGGTMLVVGKPMGWGSGRAASWL
jgi:hypothetical protein